MVDMSLFKMSKGKEQIDIQEAYNIWNLARARYQSIETVLLLKNFIHDRDFHLIAGRFIMHWRRVQDKYEAEAKKFFVSLPQRPPVDIVTSVQINEIDDAYIYRVTSTHIIGQLYSLLPAYRSCTTNDKVRQLFRQDLIEHLEDFETIYKFGKAKSWQEPLPAYKKAKPVRKEEVALSEAFHIWDNISHRYRQIQLTQTFLGFAHDKDFSLILTQGLKNLDKQVKMLEREAIKYEIPLPNQPPASMDIVIDPEAIKDRFMYGTILRGIQDALDLNIRALIESITNDVLRKLFFEFLSVEMDNNEKMLKYGKVKGWIDSPPAYGQPV